MSRRTRAPELSSGTCADTGYWEDIINETIRTDVVVVGLGVMGAMTLWRLAARGVPAVGVEQFGIAHDRGSSHGGSRIFRRIVFEGTPYVPVVEHAETLWRELEAVRGRPLLETTGGVNIGTVGGELLRDAVRVAEDGGVSIELLHADAIRSRFPQHSVNDDDLAVYEPGAGVLRPEAAIEEAVDAAVALGASVITGVVVSALTSDGDEVRVQAGDTTIIAKRAVVATGAWFDDLLPEALVPIRVQRSILHWFAAGEPERFGPREFPVFIRESGPLEGWGIPDIDGNGTKIGISAAAKSWLRRPEDNWTPAQPSDTAPVEDFARQAFTGLAAHARLAVPCMNAKTPDGDFIIGESSRLPGVVLLGGFSGHGFKHASAVGDIAAGLASGGAHPIPVAAFSPDRFGPDPWAAPAEPVFDPEAAA